MFGDRLGPVDQSPNPDTFQMELRRALFNEEMK